MRRQGGGSIVNVSSGTTPVTPSGTGGYAATKATLNTLSFGGSAPALTPIRRRGTARSTSPPYAT
jgi:NAD(P)-dependent dehydrogenase (short-subunit alcohol dehydrogenase family)